MKTLHELHEFLGQHMRMGNGLEPSAAMAAAQFKAEILKCDAFSETEIFMVSGAYYLGYLKRMEEESK